ncbi:hypothetical protein SKAU_G00045680 [Synaphobranchus kaupii]|uniref:Uncharacterized protein n=1 Tax=Synaphobranchus kaupii TaxID=118154 RepID=A0A9Q1G1Z1_SYNKA|nr:hypothetical protein SKAU_G00045680 [Synaphobranchus kaupii]
MAVSALPDPVPPHALRVWPPVASGQRTPGFGANGTAQPDGGQSGAGPQTTEPQCSLNPQLLQKALPLFPETAKRSPDEARFCSAT